MRRLRLLAVGAVTSMFAAFGVVAPAQAADFFLEIDGVSGESQDAKFQKAIDVPDFNWSAASDKKSAQLEELTIKHSVDLASPALFQRLVQGTTIPSMELHGRSSGEIQVVFIRYCFQNVQVTSIEQSGPGDEGPEETVSFAFGALSEQYSTQDAKGGIGQTVFAGWNATTGQLIPSYPLNCGTPGQTPAP